MDNKHKTIWGGLRFAIDVLKKPSPNEWEIQQAIQTLSDIKNWAWKGALPLDFDEPPPGLLMSMAICDDHALGLDGYYDQFEGEGAHKRKVEIALGDMMKFWEEVVGKGYFKYKEPLNSTAWEPVPVKHTHTLLPCPFCGHQPFEENLIDSVHPENRSRTLWVANCLASEGGCDASMLDSSREAVIRKWNTRAPAP
jgi:hypothetical protein